MEPEDVYFMMHMLYLTFDDRTTPLSNSDTREKYFRVARQVVAEVQAKLYLLKGAEPCDMRIGERVYHGWFIPESE